jgi:hypothetical protein
MSETPDKAPDSPKPKSLTDWTSQPGDRWEIGDLEIRHHTGWEDEEGKGRRSLSIRPQYHHAAFLTPHEAAELCVLLGNWALSQRVQVGADWIEAECVHGNSLKECNYIECIKLRGLS